MCGIHLTNVYSDTHQSTVVTDNHPTCAVLVLKISEYKGLNAAIAKLKQIPKLCIKKTNVDDGIIIISKILCRIRPIDGGYWL